MADKKYTVRGKTEYIDEDSGEVTNSVELNAKHVSEVIVCASQALLADGQKQIADAALAAAQAEAGN